ncbi:penicillin-binding transpeptidase domain-containing protein [Companilactobacillus metriopterae]|uniref:penicillin-binding transpeptidase domain-containing protein n=1 Tax=Companilactobacillus metriopterae TaxID=1909267 RepID=UPI00100BB18E|nr:penicillin-binding transpeptidase domain-containing protein [Companilactobacillus metriopterae]
MNFSNFRRIIKNNLSDKKRRNATIVGLIIGAVTILSFSVFIGQFSSVAITKSKDGINLSDRTKLKYQKVQKVNAKRGDIFDSTGNVIAGESTIYNVYAVLSKKATDENGKPAYVNNKEKVAEVLSDNLAISKEQALKFLNPSDKGAYQVEFGSAGRGISIEAKKKIASKNLQGIQFTELPSRSYPNGVFATNLVGITKSKSSDTGSNISGVMGIEKYFNKVLSGKDGETVSKVDSNNNILPGSQTVGKQSENGSNVYLTLNSKVQQYVEVLSQNVEEKYDPKNLQVIVMNAKTGAIEAATQRPTFNPSTGKGLENSWRDTLVEDQYEPGSVMKILTLSASIDSGHYNPNEYFNSGSVEIGSRKISDWDKAGWGSIPLSQAFPRSSNVGMVTLEQEMGAKTWLKYMKDFHMGQKTGIELPGEVPGMISFDHASDQAMTSFGQSVNVNAIQMLQAISAIANNGVMVQPQIVKKVVDPTTGKTTQKFKTNEVGKPIKASTAKQVRNAMREVVTADYGTGRVYDVPDVEVGVKTGTAQIASPTGGYLTGSSNYIFSVAGMVPYKDPKYIVYITMKQPQLMTEGAEQIISEIFNPLVTRLVNQGDTPIESTNASSQYITVPNLLNKSVDDASKEVEKLGLQTGIIGTGNKIVQQIPTSGDKVMSGQRIVLLTNGAMTMPDLTGWSKNDVLKFAEITGKTVQTKGDGYVTKQSIKSGKVLEDKTKIVITLKDAN